MNDDNLQLSLDLLRRIDTVCDQFEEAWRGGKVPCIEDYIESFRTNEQRAFVFNALQQLREELIRYPANRSNCRKIPTEGRVNTPSHHDRTDHKTVHSNLSSHGISRVENSPRVTCRVVSGPHEGLVCSFEQYNTLLAGREPGAQLLLEKDRHFSRHHFRLEINPPICFLIDLNSRNGTFVNGKRVTDHFLQDGDTISGGVTKIVVKIFDPAAIHSASNNRMAESCATVQMESSLPESPPASHDGESAVTIPGYKLFEQIGTGDLGAVYRAQRLSTNEQCAVKLLVPPGHVEIAAYSVFLREASVLHQLQHPNIIRLIEVGATGRQLFLATEYAKTYQWSYLASRYTAEKRNRIACGIMVQILGGLQYAHARSFVHRDVKPRNILITKEANKIVAKLADFGLAKQYTNAGMSQVTSDGAVLGSLPFMSPDQFINSRDAQPACDIYSAGATLFWMLTGHPPIPLGQYPSKFRAILEVPATPIRQYNSVIHEQLAQIIHCSLEKNPERRFASAAEMRRQLRRFMH